VFKRPDILGSLKYRHGIEDKTGFKGISYYECNAIRNMLPSGLQSDFEGLFLEITTPYILPHTDSDAITSVNFYCEAHGATYFYDIKDNADTYKLPSQSTGCIYHLKDLVVHSSFSAIPGDTYILDVSKVHDVISMPPRSAYCLITNKFDIHEVNEILKGL
jgi:hypothetical protein